MRRYWFHPDDIVTFQTTWSGMAKAELTTCDEVLQNHFHDLRPWGIEAAIDLSACNPALLRDPAYLQVFMADLCEKNQLRQVGEPQLVPCSPEERMAGSTLVQLNETSSMVAHVLFPHQAASVNVFSRTFYAPVQCAVRCQQWFTAQEVRLSVLFRGPAGPQPPSSFSPPEEDAEWGRK